MRNNPARLWRLIAPVLLLSAGSLLSTPAAAQWETVHGYANGAGGSCGEWHSDSPQLRRSDGRAFEIPAGFKGEIEIYGHWLDRITDASIPNRNWAAFARGVGGAENAIRGCGAIGSLVVSIDVPHTTPAGDHRLNFGDQSLRVRIIKPSILRTIWSPQSVRRPSSAGAPGAVLPPTPPRATYVVDSGPCGQSGEPGCANGIRMVRQPPGGVSMSSPDDPPRLPPALGRCIDEAGGSADISGSTLTVTLPTSRGSERTISCLTRPLYFNVEMDRFRGDVGGFRAPIGWLQLDRGRAVDPPRYSRAPEGLIGPTPLADPNRDFQQIRMTEDFARTFVGERRILFRPRAGSGATPLTLVLLSDPGIGVGLIEGVPFTGVRLASTFEVRFDFFSAHAVQGPVFSWALYAADGPNPLSCFAETSGSLTARSAIARFRLTVREAASCANARFHLRIWPEVNGRSFLNAPYAKLVTFELPPLTPIRDAIRLRQPRP